MLILGSGDVGGLNVESGGFDVIEEKLVVLVSFCLVYWFLVLIWSCVFMRVLFVFF